MIQAVLLLTTGSPFVIYHEFMEPLVECYSYLIQRELAVRVVLADTWLREYQILPGRSHPNMYMSGSGGYLLHGVYIGAKVVELVKSISEPMKVNA